MSNPEIANRIGALVEECFLQKLEVAPEEITDWEKTLKPSKVDVMEKIDKVVELIKTSDISSSMRHEGKASIVALILLIGEHSDCSKPWSSPEIKAKCDLLAGEVITILGENYGGSSLGECFIKDLENRGLPRKSLFFTCLQALRNKLKPSLWKYYPAVVVSFMWLVPFVKYPFLSDFAGQVLSPTLLLIDDYNDENKLAGIKMLTYGIDNLNKADLLRDNWSLVVYNALHHLMHDKNQDVIDGLFPILMSILSIVEVHPSKSCEQFTKYDETMRKILFSLDTCTERSLRLTWVIHVTNYLKTLGHATLHWSSKLCDCLLQYTVTNDVQLWKQILMCLSVQVKNTWTKPNSLKTVEIILRLILNCSVPDFPGITTEDQKDVIESAKEVINLVAQCSDYSLVANEILTIKANKKFHPSFVQSLDDCFP